MATLAERAAATETLDKAMARCERLEREIAELDTTIACESGALRETALRLRWMKEGDLDDAQEAERAAERAVIEADLAAERADVERMETDRRGRLGDLPEDLDDIPF